MRSNTGTLVVTPGSQYRPYCKTCSWEGVFKNNLEDARRVQREHHSKEHG